MLNVLSIGGNALNNSKNLENLLDAIGFLAKKGGLLIVHGNGPQVGELSDLEGLNLGVLTAQTEAEMGIFLAEEISKRLSKGAASKAKVEVVLTKVRVDPKDAAFKNPTKPIGRFYTEAQARRLERRFTLKRLVHGYRRVVASPSPKEIMNLGTILELLRRGYIVVAGGGGGIPIAYRGKRYEFADAVIDKDYTSALLAKSLGAKRLFILTNVDGAYIDFGKKKSSRLAKVRAKDLLRHLRQGQFEQGSMGPKVEACVSFVKATGGVAAIGNLKRARDTVALKNCTIVTA
ncbi:MAG: carbamate kinase [Candidatus Micrarchaeota archaeon]|nr:carbamate kinase [Candidatus Micrarchaeota archaeon]